MAQAAFILDDDFAIKLSRLSTDMDSVAYEAVYAGTEIAADKVRENLEKVLSEEATGQMEDSFGITPITKTYAQWSAHVGFDGYDNKGVPNQLKARAMESGTDLRRKKPFVRPAMNQTKKRIQEKMKAVIEERTKEIFG